MLAQQASVRETLPLLLLLLPSTLLPPSSRTHSSSSLRSSSSHGPILSVFEPTQGELDADILSYCDVSAVASRLFLLFLCSRLRFLSPRKVFHPSPQCFLNFSNFLDFELFLFFRDLFFCFAYIYKEELAIYRRTAREVFRRDRFSGFDKPLQVFMDPGFHLHRAK